MSTNPAPTPTLKCKECSYENEPERVYCHNCGAKLDRSVLPKEEQIRRESPEKARKRIMRMTNPGDSVLKRELSAFVKTMVFALLMAMLVQMVRPPDNLPPAKSDALPRLVASDLGDLADSPTPKAGSFTEAEINNYLKSGKVVAKGNLPGVEFKRAFVDLEPGTVRVVMEKAVFGYSLYVGALYRTEASNGVLIFTNTGGNIGRLPIDPHIMDRAAPFFFSALGEALTRERGMLAQMQTIIVRKDRVDLISKGKK